MRLFFIFLVCFYIGGLSYASAAPPVFHQLITTYFDGVAHKDFRKLVAVTTKDFIINEFGKTWTNDSVFKNIQFHEPFKVTFAITDFVAFADARSGDATYHSHADFVFGNQQARQEFYETATFRKTAAGWKINMIQVSAVASPEVDRPPSYLKYDTVRYIPEHYTKRCALFDREGVSANQVVFFGNSITEFGDWKQLLQNSGAVNRGIAGDNTFGMLDRLAGVIALRPKTVYIEAGVNDIGQNVPPALIAANIGSMVQYLRVKSPASRVYVLSVLPTNENVQTDYPEIAGKNATAREVDRLLAAQAVFLGYTYLDLASRVASATGDLDTRYAQPDGLHLNKAGYALWIAMIKGQ